jgi:hypothetical protein
MAATLLVSISPQSLAKFEDRVREHWDTRSRSSQTSKELRDSWSRYLVGWWGYYGRAEDVRSVLRKSGWIRRHIRKCFWQRWHSGLGRERALRKLGVPEQRVRIGRSSGGAWRLAANAVMHQALSNACLRRYGFCTPEDLAALRRR